MVDVLIVGFGLSGVALASHLEQKGKVISVVDANHQKASFVAAGLYNPVILKRFTLAWNAHQQLLYANGFYSKLGTELNSDINKELPVYRMFRTVEEQNNWFAKSNTPSLELYLDTDLKESISGAIESDYKYGRVKHTGRIALEKLINTYTNKLKLNNSFLEEDFDFSALKLKSNSIIEYKDIKAKKIIFCEGFGLLKNPFFNYLPLIGNKGCYLLIKSADLRLTSAVKSRYFLIPMGNDVYKFGATYEHQFKVSNHNDLAKQHLIEELKKLIDVSYEIIDFQIGTRPTVIDRRPLLGLHPEHPQLVVFNGMGTRGVLIAPTTAKQLVNFLYEDQDLDKEVDIKRFASLWKGHISEIS